MNICIFLGIQLLLVAGCLCNTGSDGGDTNQAVGVGQGVAQNNVITNLTPSGPPSYGYTSYPYYPYTSPYYIGYPQSVGYYPQPVVYGVGAQPQSQQQQNTQVVASTTNNNNNNNNMSNSS